MSQPTQQSVHVSHSTRLDPQTVKTFTPTERLAYLQARVAEIVETNSHLVDCGFPENVLSRVHVKFPT